MSRTLYALPGGADTLPAGTIRPARQAPAVANLRSRQRPQPAATHPSMYDWGSEADTTVMVPLSLVELGLVLGALDDRARGNSLRPGSTDHAELATRLHILRRGLRTVAVDGDPTPAHGIDRPERGA